MIRFKQTVEELEKNVADLFASYEEKGRKLTNSNENGRLLTNWLLQNCVDKSTGSADGSLHNMRRAIQALHQAKTITWDKEPTKTIQKPQQEDYRHSLEVAVRDAKKVIDARQAEADLEAIGAAINIIKTHNNYPHSRAEKERNALASEFDKQKIAVSLGKQTAAGLLAAVKKMKESF